MKKILTLAILIVLSFIFGGCPYESAVPIDAPSVKINSSLLGNWMAQDDSDSQYLIAKKDENNYSIKETSQSSGEINYYVGYASVIDGITFINLYKTDALDSDYSYLLYKLTINSPDQFTLAEITDNVDEQFTSGKDLKKFIASNMQNSYFFNKDEPTFIRMGK